MLAPCMLMGNKYGVGIGLYFQTIAWIRWLFFWLALCMVRCLIDQLNALLYDRRSRASLLQHSQLLSSHPQSMMLTIP